MRITKITKNKKSESLIFLDDQSSYILDNYVLASNDLKENQEISEEKLQEILFDSDLKRAKEKAFCILELRDHSKFELVSKLKKFFSENIAVAAADKMQDLNLINDANFSKKFARELLLSKHFSKYRAKFELSKKGISSDLIEETLEDFEVDEIEIIRELVEKKYKNAFSDERVKRRAVAFLQRQGYKFENIRQVLFQ